MTKNFFFQIMLNETPKVVEKLYLLRHSGHTPFCRGGGVEPPTTFSKREGLTGTQLLEGCWERGGDFFQGGCNFHIKNKLKSEIFNDKKSKNIFLCHN